VSTDDAMTAFSPYLYIYITFFLYKGVNMVS